MTIRPYPIRPRFIASASAFTLLLGLPLGAQETFAFKWQESGIAKKVNGQRPHSIMLAAEAPASIKMAPPGLIAPLYGSFAMGPAKAAANIGVILDVTADKQQHLYVDANGNGDFTDDPACTWAHPAKVGDTGAEELAWEGAATVAIPLAGGIRNGRVCFYVTQTGADGKLVQPVIFHFSDFGWVGDLKLDGKTIPAVLEDGGGAADLHLDGNRMDTPLLWLDLPGKARTVMPSRPFDLDGKWWAMANLTADGAFEIKPAPKPAGADLPTGPDLSPGHPAPAFAAVRTDGEAVKFPGDYQGKVVLIDFWARWCGPCIMELPNVVKAYDTYHARGLEVLGICLDKEPAGDALADFTSKKNMAWPQVCDGKGWNSAVSKLYGINSIPRMMLVNGSTGVILSGEAIRGEKLAPAIEKALAAVAGKPTDAAAAPPAAPAPAAPGHGLKPGDPAPALCPGKWLQGEPVAEFAPGTVYVVEFWATWCGPCKASIPHLNELHLKYKDQGLVVIGQDCWERNDAAVEPFVRNMAEHMTYRVTADDKADGGKGRMANAWLTAAGLNGIPAAFIIDKQGKIAWIGHPMKMEATMLEAILAGKYDTKKAAEEVAREEKQAAMTTAGRLRGLQVTFTRQLAASQWPEAEVTMGEIDKLAADLSMPTMKFVYNQLRLKLFLAKKDLEGAVTFASSLVEASPGQDVVPILIASDFAGFPDLKGPALDYATKLARDGYAKGGMNAKSFTATLARLEMIQGHLDKAVELQTQAIRDVPEQAPDATRAQLAADLESYKAGKLPPPRG